MLHYLFYWVVWPSQHMYTYINVNIYIQETKNPKSTAVNACPLVGTCPLTSEWKNLWRFAVAGPLCLSYHLTCYTHQGSVLFWCFSFRTIIIQSRVVVCLSRGSPTQGQVFPFSGLLLFLALLHFFFSFVFPCSITSTI